MSVSMRFYSLQMFVTDDSSCTSFNIVSVSFCQYCGSNRNIQLLQTWKSV